MESKFKLTPPQKVTVVDSIIEQIVISIRDGVIKPGEKLPSERQLIDMLGVSRSSVREALQGLAAMDLVETRPGEGTFVKKQHASFSFTGKQISQLSSELQKEMRHQLNRARLVLEGEILSLAAENITPESADEIRNAWEELNVCEQKSIKNPDNMNWEIHDRFHQSFAKASANPFLDQILKTLITIVPESLRDKNLTYGNPEESKRLFMAYEIIHRKMCEAVLRGDSEAAKNWMTRHSDYENINIKCHYGEDDTANREAYENELRALANE